MQAPLFDNPAPEGFLYRAAFITAEEERDLLAAIAHVPFAAVEMRGGVARRRTAHFGWAYGYYARRTTPGDPLPSFLWPLRERLATLTATSADAWAEGLLTEYPPGAPIGWHRDAPMFGDVAGVSLLSRCRMKFRPYVSPAARTPGAPPRRSTHDVLLEPRSLYVMTGVARQDYEHHIPAVAEMRYSITFRTLRR